MQELAQKYTVIREEIKSRSPHIWDDVKKLCDNVPERIDKQIFWESAREKPCWSNVPVKTGELLVSQLRSSAPFNSYTTIASEAWAIHFNGCGDDWRENCNYDLIGETVSQFISSLNGKGFPSYRWKLFAIRSLAVGLSNDKKVKFMIDELAQKTCSEKDPVWLQKWVKSFKKLAGRGWGTTSIYHALTDLGLTPKPDKHLVRSVVRIGLIQEVKPSETYEQIERLGSKLEHEAVQRVIELSNHISPEASPNARSSLREVDKVLMEWSRQGLARPL